MKITLNEKQFLGLEPLISQIVKSLDLEIPDGIKDWDFGHHEGQRTIEIIKLIIEKYKLNPTFLQMNEKIIPDIEYHCDFMELCTIWINDEIFKYLHVLKDFLESIPLIEGKTTQPSFDPYPDMPTPDYPGRYGKAVPTKTGPMSFRPYTPSWVNPEHMSFSSRNVITPDTSVKIDNEIRMVFGEKIVGRYGNKDVVSQVIQDAYNDNLPYTIVPIKKMIENPNASDIVMQAYCKNYKKTNDLCKECQVMYTSLQAKCANYENPHPLASPEDRKRNILNAFLSNAGVKVTNFDEVHPTDGIVIHSEYYPSPSDLGKFDTDLMMRQMRGRRNSKYFDQMILSEYIKSAEDRYNNHLESLKKLANDPGPVRFNERPKDDANDYIRDMMERRKLGIKKPITRDDFMMPFMYGRFMDFTMENTFKEMTERIADLHDDSIMPPMDGMVMSFRIKKSKYLDPSVSDHAKEETQNDESSGKLAGDVYTQCTSYDKGLVQCHICQELAPNGFEDICNRNYIKTLAHDYDGDDECILTNKPNIKCHTGSKMPSVYEEPKPGRFVSPILIDKFNVDEPMDAPAFCGNIQVLTPESTEFDGDTFLTIHATPVTIPKVILRGDEPWHTSSKENQKELKDTADKLFNQLKLYYRALHFINNGCTSRRLKQHARNQMNIMHTLYGISPITISVHSLFGTFPPKMQDDLSERLTTSMNDFANIKECNFYSKDDSACQKCKFVPDKSKDEFDYDKLSIDEKQYISEAFSHIYGNSFFGITGCTPDGMTKKNSNYKDYARFCKKCLDVKKMNDKKAEHDERKKQMNLAYGESMPHTFHPFSIDNEVERLREYWECHPELNIYMRDINRDSHVVKVTKRKNNSEI